MSEIIVTIESDSDTDTVIIAESDSIVVDLDIEEDIEVNIEQEGPQGVAGLQGATGAAGVSGGSYTHQQSMASNEWIITHNLGYHPNVTVVDSSGSRVITTIEYMSLNIVKSTTVYPFSGAAYLT